MLDPSTRQKLCSIMQFDIPDLFNHPNKHVFLADMVEHQTWHTMFKEQEPEVKRKENVMFGNGLMLQFKKQPKK